MGCIPLWNYFAKLFHSDAEPEFASEMEIIVLPDAVRNFVLLVEPEFASEMEIIVLPDAVRNFVLLVDGDNIVEDVLVEILGSDRAGRAPEPQLYFNDIELQKQKTLADYGIKLGSVLHLNCTPRVLAHTYGPTKIAKMGYANSGSSVTPNGDGEMKIFVQSEYYGNYVLEVDNSNTIEDVLIVVLPIGRLEDRPVPKLYFSSHLLERDKSLADYSIQDGSILHLEGTDWVKLSANERERPNVISNRKKIIITDQSLAIWENEHDKVLLGLLVEQIRNGGRKILYFKTDSWHDIVAKFNAATGLKYDYKHLYKRFSFYACEYHIVNRIRHHPKFSWDHQRQVIIATDTNWNEYIKEDLGARPYRWRAVPYIDLLEIMFADKEES